MCDSIRKPAYAPVSVRYTTTNTNPFGTRGSVIIGGDDGSTPSGMHIDEGGISFYSHSTTSPDPIFSIGYTSNTSSFKFVHPDQNNTFFNNTLAAYNYDEYFKDWSQKEINIFLYSAVSFLLGDEAGQEPFDEILAIIKKYKEGQDV